MRHYNLEKLRILVVDDSPHMRDIMRRIVRIFGMRQFAEAADGTQAMKVLAAFGPDIVITNWEMSPMNGLEFVRRVRTHPDSANPLVPIIMVTGHAEMKRVIEARNAGINEFLTKPLSAKALHGRIVRIIEKPRVFVRCDGYFGPDRRMQAMDYEGPERRLHAPPAPAGTEAVVDWVDR
jgi:CheY-like chemotaxis protein